MLPTLSSHPSPVQTNSRQLLPDDPRPWYRVPHLLRLNLILLIPLVSSGCIGYDGESNQLQPQAAHLTRCVPQAP